MKLPDVPRLGTRFQSVHPLTVLFIASMLAVATGMLAGGAPGETTAGGVDCRLISPTPTATGTPTPTPPWIPMSQHLVCNDTDQTVNDLHIVISRDVDNPEPVSFGGTGCPAATWAYAGASPPAYRSVGLFWPEPCVDPGEFVYVTLWANCVTPQPGCTIPALVCASWTIDGVAVTPQATARINPSLCSGTIPTWQPTPASTPTPVPTPTPTPASASTTTTATAAPTTTAIITPAQLPATGGSGGPHAAALPWHLLLAALVCAIAAASISYRQARPR